MGDDGALKIARERGARRSRADDAEIGTEAVVMSPLRSKATWWFGTPRNAPFFKARVRESGQS